jgi:hypothetical protein
LTRRGGVSLRRAAVLRRGELDALIEALDPQADAPEHRVGAQDL